MSFSFQNDFYLLVFFLHLSGKKNTMERLQSSLSIRLSHLPAHCTSSVVSSLFYEAAKCVDCLGLSVLFTPSLLLVDDNETNFDDEEEERPRKRKAPSGGGGSAAKRRR